jgi:hypothetical protein
MPTTPTWRDGESKLPQARTSNDVEMLWSDGQSGLLGVPQPTGGGGETFPDALLVRREPAWTTHLRM